MKHKSSQSLYGHWNEKRSHRALPERSDIDPSGIRGALADTFILSFDAQHGHPFRLAGTRVCALFGAELKNIPFLPLWRRRDQPAMERLIATSVDDLIGLVAAVTGHCRGYDDIDMELLILPLRHCGQTHLRLIGALGPLVPQAWLGSTPLDHLTIGDYRYLGHEAEAVSLIPTAVPPLLPAAAPRTRHGLIVYDGGKS